MTSSSENILSWILRAVAVVFLILIAGRWLVGGLTDGTVSWLEATAFTGAVVAGGLAIGLLGKREIPILFVERHRAKLGVAVVVASFVAGLVFVLSR